MLKQRSNSNGLHDRRELSRLKTIVKALGERAIDGRTALGRTLAQWKNNLITDLGGRDTISTQEQAIVDLAVKTKLILDSIDNWLLTQPSLINKRRRCLLPIVKDRTQLADALARYLSALGLQRRGRTITALHDYVQTRYTKSAESNAHGDGSHGKKPT